MNLIATNIHVFGIVTVFLEEKDHILVAEAHIFKSQGRERLGERQEVPDSVSKKLSLVLEHPPSGGKEENAGGYQNTLYRNR